MASAATVYVRLDTPSGECQICGEHLPHIGQGVPMHEDLVLPNDWSGEWAGFDACLPCFEAQATLTAPMPVWDFREQLRGLPPRTAR